ncbi:MAG: hypothetical protein ACLTDF_02530 [Coprococcus sp.]
MTEAVARRNVIAEATGAVAQAAGTKSADVIGDEYMGLSGTSRGSWFLRNGPTNV